MQRNAYFFIISFLAFGFFYETGTASIDPSSHSNPVRNKRSARKDLSWTRNQPFGIVFVYANDFDSIEISNILSAAKEIQQHSCININVYSYQKFLLSGGYNNRAFRNYVYISKNHYKGCFATIGMMGGMQNMNLDPAEGCTVRKAAILHEFIHALGYDHEQNRPDRDQFVYINFGNVIPGKESNFKIKPMLQAVGPYDYSSIMQYGAYSFSKSNSYPTIISRYPGYRIPQWSPSNLSEIDKKKIQFITGCNSSF